MAGIKKGGALEAQLKLREQAKKPNKWLWAGLGILVGIVAIVGINNSGFGNSNVLEIKNHATLNVPYDGFDFAPTLIPLLNPDYDGDRNGYTFYLGSGTGFPPMGLILGVDGILRGTPTGKAGNFEVCVKDVGGNFICRTIHLTVDSASDDNDDVNPGKCPATSAQTSTPCGSVQNGVAVVGVIVYDYCECPSDTVYSGTTDRVTPGGPYKICTCNK